MAHKFNLCTLLFAILVASCISRQSTAADALQIQSYTDIHLLKDTLSHNATVTISERDVDAGRSSTARWSVYASPQYKVVVEVATEEDVISAVKFANQRGIPFFAVNGGHGSTLAPGNLKDGMELKMRKMNKMTLDGDTVIIQGGTLGDELNRYLHDANKRTVLGVCGCVGVLGALLGGGHGLLQGRYGLIADQLINARVVLANGTVVSASKDENSDLFWGLRGAGHNFGIVTEAKLKVYHNEPNRPWYHETYTFRAEKTTALLDFVFEEIQALAPEFFLIPLFLRVPSVDPVNALVGMILFLDGPSEAAEKYRSILQGLEPIVFTNGTASLPDLSSIAAVGSNDATCVDKGDMVRLRFPVYMNRHDESYAREIYSLFNETTYEYPELQTSLLFFEGYSQQAVKAVPLESTAVAVRDHGMFVSPIIEYRQNPLIDEVAIEFGHRVREAAVRASHESNYRAYVNYAFGDETIESRYGYDKDRLARLLRLKKEYDPANSFRWYNPLIPE